MSPAESGRDVPRQAGIARDDLQRLWAPWRSGYVVGGDPIDGCPFCVLPARGASRDRESLILHRGKRVYVIFNAYPYNPGHLMVVPFAHVDDVGGLDDETNRELWTLTTRCVAVVRDRLSAEGVNVGMNLGAAAGAGIAAHVHQHVVPRWRGDTNFMSVVASTRVLPQALASTYDALADAFA
ncbi:MAG: HIT domain-containing protein [Nitriliruptoraceae bacterium]